MVAYGLLQKREYGGVEEGLDANGRKRVRRKWRVGRTRVHRRTQQSGRQDAGNPSGRVVQMKQDKRKEKQAGGGQIQSVKIWKNLQKPVFERGVGG